MAAGIGAYLYTALAAVVLAIGPADRQVQCLRRAGKSDLLLISPATEAWLRDGYRTRMSTPTVLRDLGPVLAHGEPDDGIGQGESTEAAAQPAGERAAAPVAPSAPAAPANGRTANGAGDPVTIDFRGLGARRAAFGMRRARARLAALATAAGYDRDALSVIADAALPAHWPDERLDEDSLGHLCSAIEVLAQCGHTATVVADIAGHYRARYGEGGWREQFWRRQLHTACLRYRHPRFYGLSPCEADPTRFDTTAIRESRRRAASTGESSVTTILGDRVA